MTTVLAPLDDWKTIPWARVERAVFKLQKRSYQAAQRGNVKALRRLQRLLVTSRSAKLWAVRRVTQDNRGKHTAGVAGVRSLTPRQRSRLAATLTFSAKVSPTRRVWIPKPGGLDRRPLGIPTLQDRAAQALLKLALEPEWEARFEPNSYGFRPGRSAHDAIQAIFNALRGKAKYVLDADIAKCFDRIDHAALLAKLHTTPTFRRAVRAWLQAGVLDDGDLFPTATGTPQGGVLSPLLANIALHGLETALRAVRLPDSGTEPPQGRRKRPKPPIVVRYADDFVVLHTERAVVEAARVAAAEWLRDLGLELQPSKTRITHTLLAEEGRPGFDFLGFHVRQYPVGKTHRAPRSTWTAKTLIKPSQSAMLRQQRAIGQVIRRHRATTQGDLITSLNPRIVGWSRYYRGVAASAAFSKLDNSTYLQLRAWAQRRHRRKSQWWVMGKYWHRLGKRRFTFAVNQGQVLRLHAETHIWRHVKVRGAKSPLDGDWSYWAGRSGLYPGVPPRLAWLLRKQHGRCPACRIVFVGDPRLVLDHVVPLDHGGQDTRENLPVLHQHCHEVKQHRS